MRMSLEEADEIRLAFGKFIEVAHGSLMMVFQTAIPESTLPFPKETIGQALDMCIRYADEQGNRKMVQELKGGKVWLGAYIDDRTALTLAYNRQRA
jgi:hypothetical protein